MALPLVRVAYQPRSQENRHHVVVLAFVMLSRAQIEAVLMRFQQAAA
jgi:hypothetical protein